MSDWLAEIRPSVGRSAIQQPRHWGFQDDGYSGCPATAGRMCRVDSDGWAACGEQACPRCGYAGVEVGERVAWCGDCGATWKP